MYDSLADSALSSCGDGPTPATWSRLFLKLGVAYVALAALSCTECSFRDQSVEVEGRVEPVGAGPKPNTLMVRYHFTDPVTHKPRMNTTRLPVHLVPNTPTAIVQYIPGEMPSSRLKVETRSEMPSVFFWVNVVFGVAAMGLIGYIAWEANHPIQRPRNRCRNYALR